MEESTVLPELSFDDFLDPSPVKKNIKSNGDDDASEFDSDRNSRTDDILNTPCPKYAPIKHVSSSTTALAITGASKTFSTPVRTQAVKLGNSPSVMASAMKSNSGATTTTPVLLNSKNILPKASVQLSNNSIKLTPKNVGNNANITSLTITGKIRTSNGKIIYIQKTAPPSNTKTSATSNQIKPQTSSANNSKPMTIPVLRTADGNYVPIKSSAAGGANGKNTTLTLSPTSLAGKKIITSSGGQVIIKGANKTTDSTNPTVSGAKTITTNAITGVKTIVKPTNSTTVPTSDANKPKPIVVHGTGGKKIIVSNQNIVKLSPKPAQGINSTAGGTGPAAGASTVATTSNSGTAQIHAIQIPGKIGVQYVRVLPNTKVAAKSADTTSTSSTAPSTAGTISKTINTTGQPVKILNPLQQKFTVVQKGGTTKLLVTQKKESTSSNNGEVNTTASKVQKTIVTVPTIKPLNDDKNKNQSQQQQQHILIKSTQANLSAGGNSNSSQAVVRKHKISEINTEIQRITTNTTSADNTGPPEMKKATPNNRVVVISGSNTRPKILNSTIQQPGRVTTLTIPNQTKSISNSGGGGGGSMVQATNGTQNGNKLYTILKPSSQEQKPTTKLYSVLKTNKQVSTTATSSSSSPPSLSSMSVATMTSTATTSSTSAAATVKSLINKQYLTQQQHKLLQQERNETVESINSRSLTSKYVLPIKIKVEPTEANSNTNSSSVELPLPVALKDDVDTPDPLAGGVRRKHCNCSKSQCLKLYCDCFANGEFCQDCTCKDCFNNLENEDERQRAIKSCLERNPNAFKPKITSSKDQSDMRLHNKGCNCKRSGCLKNYCECYEAKIPCSCNCKCVGCRNVEDRPDLDMDPIDPKIMAALASGQTSMISQKRGVEKLQRDFNSAIPGLPIKTEKLAKDNGKPLAGSMDYMPSGAVSPGLERQQCNFITQEVIDATIQCMITQADECEKNGLPGYQTEKMVMEELGRCLVEIIDFSIRNTETSYSQD